MVKSAMVTFSITKNGKQPPFVVVRAEIATINECTVSAL
ncbi:hypothetical protein Ngar_c09760 [Candidatus Nitrososphaera gargensis Ga9.2]|uniref:Uncharacterized protein n=1 Tax=Nitrososphaera gargensis (strain Ga9.2) TaxID=1237085 RepID=K0IGF9_NITGG|nr:hypothetical protein Ngar_c09760 [Candidatus Nitrososphaera gargensis Ga9.2]